MAERRMFTQKIVDSDAFLDMPLSTQALYFHLNMRADDDGFVNNPKKIQRMIGASDDDLKMLIAKRFLLWFENGVVVIKHWRMHNLLRKDRYTPTQYIEQKETLMLKDNGSYTEKIALDSGDNLEELHPDNQMATTRQPNDNQMAPQVSIVKCSTGEFSRGKESVFPPVTGIENEKLPFGSLQNVFLTQEEYTQLQEQFPSNYNDLIEKLSKGLYQYGYKYNSHYLAILQWVENDKKKSKESKNTNQTSGNPFLDLLNEGDNND